MSTIQGLKYRVKEYKGGWVVYYLNHYYSQQDGGQVPKVRDVIVSGVCTTEELAMKEREKFLN